MKEKLLTQDGFVQAVDGDELAAAELPNVDFDNTPIDAANPGFASLLPALQAFRQGKIEAKVLEDYVAGLTPRLEAAFAQWETASQQPLEELGLPEEEVAHLRLAFSSTEGLLNEMDAVLNLIDEGNHELAERRLQAIHLDIRQAMG